MEKGFGDQCRERNPGMNKMKQLLENKEFNTSWTDHDKFTPLHFSCCCGYLELIDRDSNYNIKTNNGNTPLHSSYWNGYLEVTKLLIEMEADLNTQNNGETVLHLVCKNDYIEIIKLLINNGDDKYKYKCKYKHN